MAKRGVFYSCKGFGFIVIDLLNGVKMATLVKRNFEIRERGLSLYQFAIGSVA